MTGLHLIGAFALMLAAVFAGAAAWMRRSWPLWLISSGLLIIGLSELFSWVMSWVMVHDDAAAPIAWITVTHTAGMIAGGLLLFIGAAGLALKVSADRRSESANAARASHAEVIPAQFLRDEMLAMAARATNDALWDYDPRTDAVVWSEQLLRLFGYDISEVQNTLEWWSRRVHPDDRDRVVASLQRAVDVGAESWLERYRFLRADGTYADVIDRGYMVTDDHGEPQRMIGAIMDVTEQKRTQEALYQSERHHHAIFQSNPQPMCVYDLETLLFLAVNKAFVQKYGYSHEEFASMTLKDIRPPETVPHLLASVDVVREKSTFRGMARHRLRDGTLIDVEITSNAITFEGRPAALVHVNDVTQRIRAEHALQESEQRFVTFMDNNPATAWIKDVHGRYIYVNAALCHEYRVKAEDVLGKTDHQLLPKRVADVLRANDERVLQSGTAVQTFETITNPDGTDHIWMIYKFPLQDSDGDPMVGGLGLDVTEQKQTEEALRTITEVQRLLLSELDHRVRNNLTSLVSLIELSQRRYSDTDQFAETMRSRVQTMATVHTLLSHSQWSSIQFSRLLRSLIPSDLVLRFEMNGPDVVIPVRQVTALGMVLNEFLMNSLKHGALSSASGSVDVQWTVSEPTETNATASATSPRQLDIDWTERNGGEITRQPQPGVGTNLIEGLVRSELAGKVTLQYNTDGVTHHLTVQLDTESEQATRMDMEAEFRRSKRM